MSLSSRESDLARLREALAQMNSELFLTFSERRGLTVKIQELKNSSGRYAHYDPDREKEVFQLIEDHLKTASIKELLAFSLIMEDHALAMAPGSYPLWSNSIHLSDVTGELHEKINPLLLKFGRPDLLKRLPIIQEFIFLKDF